MCSSSQIHTPDQIFLIAQRVIEKGLSNFMMGDPNTEMNWIHIENTIQAFILAAEALAPKKGSISVSKSTESQPIHESSCSYCFRHLLPAPPLTLQAPDLKWKNRGEVSVLFLSHFRELEGNGVKGLCQLKGGRLRCTILGGLRPVPDGCQSKGGLYSYPPWKIQMEGDLGSSPRV